LTILQAAILGLVQGITEFLPISSTAHLRLVPAVLSWPDSGAAFTAVLQLGTLLAVIGFFLRDLVRMIAAAANPATRRSLDARMLLYIVLGTVPIGIVGLLAKHAIEGPLRSILVIATAMVVVAIVMAIVEKTARHERPVEAFTLRDAMIVGLAQCLALVPGTSRSGITLIAAMILGYRRDAAARFSFSPFNTRGRRGRRFRTSQAAAWPRSRRHRSTHRPGNRGGFRLPRRGLAAALPAHAHDLRIRCVSRGGRARADCRRARRKDSLAAIRVSFRACST
jgi:undecaprenyl-diphosphatase